MPKRPPPIERLHDGRGAWVIKSTRRILTRDELKERGIYPKKQPRRWRPGRRRRK